MDKTKSDLKPIMEAVAKELVSLHYVGSSAAVSVPVIYPSGAGAVVNVSRHGDRFFVSDLGYGLQEAEMVGAAGSYQAAARKLAEHYGVIFDNQCFFLSEASEDELPAVITLIANCSAEAANAATLKASERSLTREFELFYRDLSAAFGDKHIERNVEVIGSSSRTWKVACRVETKGKTILFDTVTKHHNAVANTALKFHDLARVSNPPSRISVVTSIEDMGSFVPLLAQASSVIEANATSDELRQVAA